MTLPIEMVSDVVCPWCFIGKRRLEKAIALKPDIPVEVRFHPFFLNPWVPREGLVYSFDKIKRQPNTLDCHRLILWAGELGNAARMKQRIMDLYFTEGGDLTDRDVLV